jgi:hypothetical protein
MKIYYIYNNDFLDMKNHFVRSMKDDFEHKPFFMENIKLDSTQPAGGIEFWKFKTQMIIDAIKENLKDDSIILISDIDIQFFKPVIPLIEKIMAFNDMAFQQETELKGLNIGFMSIRCNSTILLFWETVLHYIVSNNSWDKQIVNDLAINKGYLFPLKFMRFPPQIWNSGHKDMPINIYLHHANIIGTQQDKFTEMKRVVNLLIAANSSA